MNHTFIKTRKAVLLSFMICATAFTLSSCSKGGDGSSALKEKFLKTWTASNQCSGLSGAASYAMVISDNPVADNRIIIKNFQGRGGNVDAVIDSNGTYVVIPDQSYNGSDTVISGTLNYESSTKTVSFSCYYQHNNSQVGYCNGSGY